MSKTPILYSFRRCPYAMRARMALVAAGHEVELREVHLKNKPEHMLELSPKGSVPVLALPQTHVSIRQSDKLGRHPVPAGQRLASGLGEPQSQPENDVFQADEYKIIDESYDIMKWALRHGNNPDWLAASEQDTDELVDENDDLFKRALDRYKYPNRYPDEATPQGDRNCDWEWRGAGEVFIRSLEKRLKRTPHLLGKKATLADYAIFPFVRQFAMTEADWWHDEAPYPSVKKWLNAFLGSALFKHVMVKHEPWQEGDAPVYLK